MKRLLFLSGAFVAVSALAAIHTVSSPNEFAAGYGADTVRYTGGSAAYGGVIAFTTAVEKSATTIEIVDAGTTLAFTGVAMPYPVRGALVKTGVGELCWKTTAETRFDGNSGDAWGGDRYQTRWDVSGAATQGYSTLQVAEGTFTLGSEKAFTAADVTVGNFSETPQQSTLRVESGLLDAPNLLTIGYGAREMPCIASVGHGGMIRTGSVWFNQRCTEGLNAGNALLDVDGGTVEVSRQGLNMGKGYGSGKILVRNGGALVFTNDLAGTIGQGYSTWLESAALTVKGVTNSTLQVAGTGSKVQASAFAGGAGGHFMATDGATVQIDRTLDVSLRHGEGLDDVTFDGATLEAFALKNVWGDWFSNVKRLEVGTHGLVVRTDGVSLLDGAATGSGTIAKEGKGLVSFQAGSADIDVREGVAALTIANDGTKADKTGVICAASGTRVLVGGDNALAAMTLRAGGQENVFVAAQPTVSQLVREWAFVHSAVPRKDGWIRLTDPVLADTNAVGAIWRKAKMDLTRSFVITWDYAVSMTSEHPERYRPYGFSVGWQTAGVDAFGGLERANGWGEGTWTGESFAFGYDAPNDSLHHTVGGRYTSEADSFTYLNEKRTGKLAERCGTFDEPVHFRIAYDATTHAATFTAFAFDWQKSCAITTSVDLASMCGDSAWFGFAGGGSRGRDRARGSHGVSNIRILMEAPESVTTDVGGTLFLDAGEAFSAVLTRDGVQKGWLVDSVESADGATLDVSGPDDAVLATKRLVGAGTLRKAGAATLQVACTTKPFSGEIVVNEGTLSVMRGQTLAPTPENWSLRSGCTDSGDNFSKFTADGFAVGRYANKEKPWYAARFDSRRRIRVNTDWEISYRLKAETKDVMANAGFFGVCFHNDSRAETPEGVPVKTAESKGQPAFCAGISNCAAVVWGGADSQGSNGFGNKVMVATGDDIGNGSAGWVPTAPVQMGYVVPNGKPFATNCWVTLSYDCEAKLLAVRMDQPAQDMDGRLVTNTWMKTFAVDIPAAVGDEAAYLSFGANVAQNWFALRTEITDFRYFDRRAVIRGADRIRVEVGATLALRDESGSRELSPLVGTLTVANGATIRIAAGQPVTADSLVVDGRLVLDGGVYAFTTPEAVSGLRVLELRNGARVSIPVGVTIPVKRLFVDGVRMWKMPPDRVIGGGSLVVEGFVFMIR